MSKDKLTIAISKLTKANKKWPCNDRTAKINRLKAQLQNA